MDKDLQRYKKILYNLWQQKDVSDEDLTFYLGYKPNVDEAKLQQLKTSIDNDIKNKIVPDPGMATELLVLQAEKAFSTPEYKERMLDLAQKAESKRVSDKIASGINMILGASDVAQAVNQINVAKQSQKQSKRPSRPGVPQRDIYLQQALRDAQEGGFDAFRATAPVQAEIQDQYLNDLQNAKTAATGQAGAYGAYGQLAANRRNRASLNLAPIQDQIRRGQQDRYNQLLGMRLDETQNMFQNQSSLYPYDLRQYQMEQEATGKLGALGRENLRDGLYNFGGQIPGVVGESAAQRRFRKLRDQLLTAGATESAADAAVKANQYLDTRFTGTMTSDDTPGWWLQAY